MKIKFDSRQEFQLDAVQAVVDVFDGQPLAESPNEIRLDAGIRNMTELGFSNGFELSEDRIVENVRRVQERNSVTPAIRLQGMNFSIEMETGTGKTYVYLRTVLELHRTYGFTKFIIVVPSVAIREGVKTSIDLTQEHFADLYGNVPMDAWVYDSKQVSKLRQFAKNNRIQILIINIDAFNKQDIAVIHRENDRLSGHKPIEFIKSTNPIVIIDEPQNMESELAQEAIASLNPLCTVRYSATHRNPYNLLYRLGPVRAYDLRLVKRIEVDSVLDDPDFNQPYVRVKSVAVGKTGPVAKLELDVREAAGPKRKTVTLKTAGTDLVQVSGGRDRYAGFVVEELDAGRGCVSFTNGIRLFAGESHGDHADEVMRVQVQETVKEHLDKELEVRRRLPEGTRLKVLSLIFIDRVANYHAADGKIRRWFVDSYDSLRTSARYTELALPATDQVHNGYFAESAGTPKDTSGRTKADDDAYSLIMRDKERLLSPDEPLRFIFSHSALREGWDNPNVFQICTLNESRSEMKKRQEIGRGLRLPVLDNGERCFDPSINRLTVVANESYEDFARRLQTEIEEECGETFGEDRIKNRRERRLVQLRKGWDINPEFLALWERIKVRTRYSVEFETDELVRRSVAALKAMPPVVAPKIHTKRAVLDMNEEGVSATVTAVREVAAVYGAPVVPDLLGYLQRETELTRSTLAEILISSGRLCDVAVNAQQFLDLALRAIRTALSDLLVDGIKYERIAGATYEMRLFEENEILGYASRLVEVERSVYDAVEFDSKVEEQFARELDCREDVKLFLKLPAWFKVETPLGTYNPDWAIVKETDGDPPRLYLVRETKGTTDPTKLRSSEWSKIRCGKAHFEALGVDFGHVTKAEEL